MPKQFISYETVRGISLSPFGRGGMPSLLCGYGLVVMLLLAGCGNPYALKLNNIKYNAKQEKGVIQFTDPKLYKREALINERRKELSYLNTLLDNSATVQFNAEIVRQVEVITAFSAALGLKFDPAAGAAFRRDSETADLKHQIEVTRLQMELAQLKRDAELLKDRLAQQTELSQDVPSGTAAGSSPTSSVTADDATALLDKIETLRSALASRLDADIKQPKMTTAQASPIDEFYDRSAYRSAIKSAINRASLDELHDKDGNSLFRLQFSATVLPPADDHTDTLGILRMEVHPPDLENDSDVIKGLYQEWLSYVNRVINVSPDLSLPRAQQRFTTERRLFALGEALFEIVYLELPKLEEGEGSPDKSCKGITFKEDSPDRCWYLRIALPLGSSLPELLDTFLQFPISNLYEFRAAAANIRALGAASPTILGLNSACTDFANSQAKELLTPLQPNSEDTPILDKRGIPEIVRKAKTLRDGWPYMGALLSHLLLVDYGNLALAREVRAVAEQGLRRIAEHREAAEQILIGLANVNERCKTVLLTPSLAEVPDTFRNAVVDTESRVAVYEVAPAERAQRISTVAQAAEAISLAASLAGQIPTYGLGVNGAVGYNRSAAGKADALERAPLVVGFAEPLQHKESLQAPPDHVGPAFGWLLGPEVSVDPENQELVLEQRLAPYDVYTDLSLPGWWPYFDLRSQTAWAPNWRDGPIGTTLFGDDDKLSRPIRVTMRHNSADMNGLTTVLLKQVVGQVLEYPSIASIQPNQISACGDTIQFQITGVNIWRASMVHVDGYAVDNGAITVLPDMSGIRVAVKVKDVPVVAGRPMTVTVWTPNGPATATVDTTGVRDGGTCVVKGIGRSPLGGPKIAGIVPARILACDPSPSFVIRGENLVTKMTTVFLGSIKGTVTSSKTIKSNDDLIEVTFNKGDVEKHLKGLGTVPLVVRTDKGAATTSVYLAEVGACKSKTAGTANSQPTGPEIKALNPQSISRCVTDPTFTVIGTGLKDTSRVTLAGVPASKINVLDKNGTQLEVKFKIPDPKGTLMSLPFADFYLINPKNENISKQVQLTGPGCP